MVYIAVVASARNEEQEYVGKYVFYVLLVYDIREELSATRTLMRRMIQSFYCHLVDIVIAN